MDYRYTVHGWSEIAAPVEYDDETIESDLTAAGYALHPSGSANEGVVFYLDADATEYPYAIDLTGVAGVAIVIWVHDIVSLTKLAQELGSLKTLLGIS